MTHVIVRRHVEKCHEKRDMVGGNFIFYQKRYITWNFHVWVLSFAQKSRAKKSGKYTQNACPNTFFFTMKIIHGASA